MPNFPTVFLKEQLRFFHQNGQPFSQRELHDVLPVGSSFCWPVEWGVRAYKCAIAHVLVWFPPPVFWVFRSTFDELEAKDIAVLYTKCRWVSCLNFRLFLRVDLIISMLFRSWCRYQSGYNAWMTAMSFLPVLKIGLFLWLNCILSHSDRYSYP